MCVFVYEVDTATEPARDRRPTSITEVHLGEVIGEDFRRNARGDLGTRTATRHAHGIAKLRRSGFIASNGAPRSTTTMSAIRCASWMAFDSHARAPALAEHRPGIHRFKPPINFCQSRAAGSAADDLRYAHHALLQ